MVYYICYTNRMNRLRLSVTGGFLCMPIMNILQNCKLRLIGDADVFIG